MSFPFNPNTDPIGKKMGIRSMLGRAKFSPGLGKGGQYKIQGHEVLDGVNFCSITFGIGDREPTTADLNEAATQLQSMPELLEGADPGGGSEAATAGNSTYPSLPVVRRGAVIIFTVPGKVECYGTPANANNLSLVVNDYLLGDRFAEHKGFKTGKDLICDEDLLVRVGKRCAEGFRKATMGNIIIVDGSGNVGMDTFQGSEFTYPDDGSIYCSNAGTQNKFCGNSFDGLVWGVHYTGTVNHARNLLENDSRFDPYHYLWVINLGCWNSRIGGGFMHLSDSTDTEDDFRIYTWADIGNAYVAGGVPGDPVGTGVHSNGATAGTVEFNPGNPWTEYPESWDWPVNLWDLKTVDTVGYWYEMFLHEVGHGSRPPGVSPNSNILGGFKHEQRMGYPTGGGSPYTDTLPCVFADTGPNDPAGVCGAHDPGNTATGMNYHNIMSYDVLNNLNCAYPNVPCSPPNSGGYGPRSPFGMAASYNTALLHWSDIIPDNNVVDLTNVDQSVPNTVIFEDWLWAGDLFHIHPEFQSLGSRKVLIKQLMHTNLPYPSVWDNAVPTPKRKYMSLQYYARGYQEYRASRRYEQDPPGIESPDGVIYLNWGPQRGGDTFPGLNDVPTYARLDVIPSNPSPPLIINGFDTEIPANPATRFYGWKIETVGFTNEPEGGKSKVKVRITSLGDAAS